MAEKPVFEAPAHWPNDEKTFGEDEPYPQVEVLVAGVWRKATYYGADFDSGGEFWCMNYFLLDDADLPDEADNTIPADTHEELKEPVKWRYA